MNAAIHAHNLVDLLQDLISVLERENEILKKPRASTLTPLVEEKQALFKLYDDQMAAIAQDSAFGASLPDDLRETLSDLAERFNEAMAANKRKLEMLTRASQHIVNRITEAAKEAAGRVPQYGQNGTVEKISKAAPVAMNQKI